jgi:hypothetical protein
MSFAQPRRRWFPRSFGMRTLLVLIIVLALPLGWIAKERRQSAYELDLAEQLRKQSFSDIQFAGPYDTKDLSGKNPPPVWWHKSARQLLGERVFLLGSARAELNDLGPLAECTNLQGLEATSAAIHDLAPLSTLLSLKVLYLDHTQIQDLTPLAGLTKLQHLAIRGTKVSDLSPLRKLTGLQWLDVCDTQASDEQIAKLQQALPNCHIQRNMKVGPP